MFGYNMFIYYKAKEFCIYYFLNKFFFIRNWNDSFFNNWSQI